MILYRGESSKTSSVFVCTKVLVVNLNDIKDTAFLKDMLIIAFNPFNLKLKGMK